MMSQLSNLLFLAKICDWLSQLFSGTVPLLLGPQNLGVVMSSFSTTPRFSQNNFKFPILDFLTLANFISDSPFLAFSCKFRLPRLSLGSLDIDFTSSLLLVASPPSLPLGHTLDFFFGNCVPVWLVWLGTVPLNNSFLGIFQLFSRVLHRWNCSPHSV